MGRKKAKFSRLWLEGIEKNKTIKQVFWEHVSGIEHIYTKSG